MSAPAVDRVRMERIPQTEITLLELDKNAFMLSESQLVKVIADAAKALEGIRMNRERG